MPALPSRSRWLAVAALLVVAGVGVVARFVLRGGGDEAGGAAAWPSASRSRADGSGDASNSARPATDGATRSADLPAPESTSSLFPTVVWEPGPPNGFPVQVVDARSGMPIPGAHLVVLPTAWGGNPLRMDSLAPRVPWSGVGFLADSQGKARVVWPAGPAWLVGEAGELRGARELEATGREDFELRLAPRRVLLVDVVNRGGKPLAGARVSWASRDPTGRVVPLVGLVAADARGRARLERPVGTEEVTGFAVWWFAASRFDPAAFVAIDDATTGPIRCVLSEECGTLEIRLVDRSGSLVDEAAHLSVVAKRRGEDREEGSGRRTGLLVEPSEFTTLPRGGGSFAPVPLGLDFQVFAQPDHGAMASGSGTGPQADGETTRLELRMREPRLVVRGRVVGVARPTDVVAALVGEASCTVKMDEGARFEFGTERRFLGESFVRLVGIDADGGDAFEGTAFLPAEDDAAEIDVGDVAVRLLPVVAVGRVLAPTREPLADVTVRREGTVELKRTDVSGRFIFSGAADSHVTLSVVAPDGYADTTVEVATGTRGVEIVLERVGSIVGRVLADRAVSLIARRQGSERYVLERPDASRGSGRATSGRATRLDEPSGDQGRTFRFDLAPGRYDLCVSLGGAIPEAAQLATIPDVDVVAGATNCDPRLDPLDLRGRIRRWRFTLERSDGAPPPSTWLRLAARTNADVYLQTLYLGNDGLSCDSSLDSAWVEVSHPGFRRIHELHDRGDVKLVLEPVDSHRFTVHVDAPVLPRPDELSLRVQAEPSWTAPVEGLDWFSSPVASDGTASVELDEGELWKVHLFVVEQQSKGGDRRCEVRRVATSLTDRDLERGSIDLHVDRADVDAALEALEKQH